MPEMNTANTTQTLTRPERKAPERKAPEHKAPERPPVIAGTRPPRDSSAGDGVLAYLRIQTHTLKTLEPSVRADEFDSGAMELGGRLPVNPSGGLLSKGEPLGASALGQIVELVCQLRGECGPRQVDGARTALSHTVGRGANAGVVILTR